MISELEKEFCGQSVVDYDPAQGIRSADLAYRLRVDWEAHEAGGTGHALLAKFCDDPKAAEVTALVIGDWGAAASGNSAEQAIKLLAASANRLPRLRALFVGDIIGEECEISWITLTDMSLLWTAFPSLECFRVRGGQDLSLGRLRSAALKSLTVETGGLPAHVLKEVCDAELPNLEHLELWLGDDGYGWESLPEDLLPILKGDRFPRLKYLGLRDSCVADEVARLAATAPILERLEVLDLSLGNISDIGAEYLLASKAIKRLKRLDLHHHYISHQVLLKLAGCGPLLIAHDEMEADDWGGGDLHRYVAVSE